VTRALNGLSTSFNELVGGRDMSLGVVLLAILLSVGLTVAALVFAAHRGQVATDTIAVLSDWARSFAMVLGGMVGAFQASFWIMTLMLSLAEHFPPRNNPRGAVA
jgi:hypothetical protein